MSSVSSCLMVVSSCFCGGLELLGVGFVLFNMLLFVLLFGGGGGFSTSPVVVPALFGSRVVFRYSFLEQYFGGVVGSGFGGGVVVTDLGGCGGHRNGCFSDGRVWWWASGGCNEQRDWYRGTTFLFVERLVLINDGAVRVRCQYLSPKLCDFSPLRRCFCDVSFDTKCVATSWLRDCRFVAALGCCLVIEWF
ncbi:hypothetical protein QL285_024706 [Trifolium repens]|nr:hypothetical protein QL285_024706 [Trifolium repens]